MLRLVWSRRWLLLIFIFDNPGRLEKFIPLLRTLRVFAGPGVKITYYHFLWSSGRLDWQRFDNCVEADECAKALVLSDETYTIEGFGTERPPCGSARAYR
jgi:hypothetical protein